MHSCKSRGWLKPCKHPKKFQNKRVGEGRKEDNSVLNVPAWLISFCEHAIVWVHLFEGVLKFALITSWIIYCVFFFSVSKKIITCHILHSAFLTFTHSVSPFRNWCPHTVTKTVTCQVQNGTVLQRVYQTCRWPQGCTGGRWEGKGTLLYLNHT